MIFVRGTNAKIISQENISHCCSQCGTHGNLYMIIYQVYYHVYGIPFSPKEKTGITHCLHCNNIIQKEDFTKDMLLSYEFLKRKSKTPIWSFIGVAILIAFVIYFSIRNNM